MSAAGSHPRPGFCLRVCSTTAARGGAGDSLDRGLFDAVRAQAGRAGLSYEDDALRY